MIQNDQKQGFNENLPLNFLTEILHPRHVFNKIITLIMLVAKTAVQLAMAVDCTLFSPFPFVYKYKKLFLASTTKSCIKFDRDHEICSNNTNVSFLKQ